MSPFMTGLKSLTLVLSLTTLAFAGPKQQKATCSGGRKIANAQCCKWFDILDDVQLNVFEGGLCDESAHESLRLVFHDSIAFSNSMTSQGQWGGGGADGSLIAFSDIELEYFANVGLDDIVVEEKAIADKWNISYADAIQFIGAVGVRNCAGGPRIPFKFGRPNAVTVAPDGLIPSPGDSVTTILARMADAGFTGAELVALMSSHSIAAQENIDDTIPNAPFDTTPAEYDSQFYLETLLKGTLWPGDGPNFGEAMSPLEGEFRLQSDAVLARDPRTSCQWESYVMNEPKMARDFVAAMEKLSFVGQDEGSLIDCSDVIPQSDSATPRVAHFPPGKSFKDLELNCPKHPKFPHVPNDPGNKPPRVPPFPGRKGKKFFRPKKHH